MLLPGCHTMTCGASTAVTLHKKGTCAGCAIVKDTRRVVACTGLDVSSRSSQQQRIRTATRGTGLIQLLMAPSQIAAGAGSTGKAGDLEQPHFISVFVG